MIIKDESIRLVFFLMRYLFAKASFEQIINLTNRYKVDEIYVTNLCNEALPHAYHGKTVLIPYDVAKVIIFFSRGKINAFFLYLHMEIYSP